MPQTNPICEIHMCKSSEISTYELGHMYFFEDIDTFGIATSTSTIKYFSGVRSMIRNTDNTNIITIINEKGDTVVLDFTDIASAQKLNELSNTVGDINPILEAVLYNV